MSDKKGVARRRARRRGGSVFGVHRKSVFIIMLMLLLFAFAAGIRCISLNAENNEYKRQEAELEAQIEEQKERREETEEFREYVKSAEYEKEVAQEKFGLVDPDDIIFKASD